MHVDGETCEVAVDVAKIGMGNIDLRENPRRARTKGVIEVAKGGVALVLREVTLKGDGSAPMVYSMRIRRAKGGLVGTFAGRGGGRELSGTLEGRAR
ncbi:MAG TPA: hypothetical protein PKW35_25820 [Nannocystaceae bacterium]|nr:hypothetical protein [Nannocystaceae bacterium]